MERKSYRHEVVTDNPLHAQCVIYNWVHEGDAILELGCASGDMGYALRQRKNCRCCGVEIDEVSRREALETEAYDRVIRLDLNRLNADDFPEWQGKFDRILAVDVLEHLCDPPSALRPLKRLLKPGGELLVSLPNVSHASIKANLLKNRFVYTGYGILDDTHLRFFTAENVVLLFSGAGFEIAEATGSMVWMGGFDEQFQGVPREALRFILHNVHSYIWQYLCRCVPSDLPVEELTRRNVGKMSFTLKDFSATFVEHVWWTIGRYCPDQEPPPAGE